MCSHAAPNVPAHRPNRNGASGPAGRSGLHFARISGLSIVAGVLVLMAGCNLGAWKEQYRGVDLIADRGYSVASFTDAYVAGTAPAYDYVNYEEITDAAVYGATTGLPATPGPIYRLELPNLLPNGDFEATAATFTPAGWDDSDAGASLVADDTAGSAITGMSAFFSVSGTQAAYFDLRTGLLDGLVYPGSYHVNLIFRRAADDTRVNFDYGNLTESFLALDNIRWQSDADPANTALDPEVFPNGTNFNVPNVFSVHDDTAHYFYLGAPDKADAVSPQQGYIDDVRIGRYDILPHVALPLGAALLDGSLEILPGRYRFSVYVKSEIDASVTPTTPNAFRPGQITLGINDLWQTTSIAAGGWTNTEWTQVTFETVLRTDDLAQPDAVTVWLTVSSPDTPMVGRILVAAPSFELVIQ